MPVIVKSITQALRRVVEVGLRSEKGGVTVLGVHPKQRIATRAKIKMADTSVKRAGEAAAGSSPASAKRRKLEGGEVGATSAAVTAAAASPVTSDAARAQKSTEEKKPVKLHPFFAKQPAKAKAEPTSTASSGASAAAAPSVAEVASSSHATAASSAPQPTAGASASAPAPAASAGSSRVLEDDGVASDASEDDDGDIALGKGKAKTKAGAGAGTSGYHPVNDAAWKAKPGSPVPYSALVSVFNEAESTRKRLEITAALTRLFRSILAVTPEDLLPTLYLCTNSLAPAYENLELGVGESLLQKALAEATGRQVKQVQADADKQQGDLGLVAESSRATQKTLFGVSGAALTIRGVFSAFKSIAVESGKSSQDKKIATIKKLLVASTGPEAKYLVRGMLGKMRNGVAKQTVMVALAHAVTLTPPLPPGTSAPAGREVYGPAERGAWPPVLLSRRATDERLEESVALLKQVYSELPSFDAVVPALLKAGIEGARAACSLTPGIPVAPMLAKPTKGIGEVLQRFEGRHFTCEWKYDGERAQVHITPSGVRIFSRNSEDTSSKYPDIGLAIKEAMGPGTGAGEASGAGAAAMPSSSAPAPAPSGQAEEDGDIVLGGAGAGASSSSSSSSSAVVPTDHVSSCILDGEAVAVDPATGRLLPFQILSTRARKDATMDSIKVPVIYVAFDCLYLNGHSLIHKTLGERRALLRSALHEVPGKFAFARSAESTDTEEIGVFLSDAVKGGCEGLMVKILDGPEAVYEPSKRSLNWLKLKKDYMDGLADSLDLVPVAAWRGKGKRAGVYGAYLLACYDQDSDEYQSVCKVGTGFSEEVLDQLTAAFAAKGCIVSSKPSNVVVGDSLQDADVWFVPEDSEVWEVRAADLSLSPVHMGGVGKVDEVRGIALRFPRFIRRRDDKGPVDATSADQVCTMYKEQATVNGGAAGDDDDDE